MIATIFRRVSSAQLVASWITGLVVIGLAWWALSSWDIRQRDYINADLDGAKVIIKGLEIGGGDPRYREFHAATLVNANRLMQAGIARKLKYLEDRDRFRPLTVAFTVAVFAGMVALTWRWAATRPPERADTT